MATGSVASVFRTPGRLVIGPTDLSLAFPYGGTSLGIVSALAVRERWQREPIPYEEFGGSPGEVIEGTHDVIVTCELRQRDDDVLTTLYPRTTTGASGEKVVRVPYGHRAGSLASRRSVVLLFASRDVTHGSWLLHRALPLLAEDAEHRQEVKREHVLYASFYGIRDASSRIMTRGRLEDLHALGLLS